MVALADAVCFMVCVMSCHVIAMQGPAIAEFEVTGIETVIKRWVGHA
jgi:hypothetical protein